MTSQTFETLSLANNFSYKSGEFVLVLFFFNFAGVGGGFAFFFRMAGAFLMK